MLITLFGLLSLIATPVLIVLLWRSKRESWGSAKCLGISVAIASVLGFAIGLRLALPIMFSKIVYHGIWLNLPAFLIVFVTLAVVGLFWVRFQRKRKKLDASQTLGFGRILGASFVIGFLLLLGTKLLLGEHYSEWATARMYRPVALQEEPKLVTLRLTPGDVVQRTMVDSDPETNYFLDWELSSCFHLDGTPVWSALFRPEPDKFLTSLKDPVPGFAIFVDGDIAPENLPGLERYFEGEASAQRVRYFRDTELTTFKVAPHLMWDDRLERRVYRGDPFCEIADVVTLPILSDPSSGERTFVLVVRKYGYRWLRELGIFPTQAVPYWKGVAIVWPNGSIEHLSAKQAREDVRLDGLPIVPVELLTRITQAQRYERGILHAVADGEDLIELPELPGVNQPPYQLLDDGGRELYVIEVEPNGGSFALNRTYYMDSHTGEYLVFQHDNRQTTALGPAAALRAVRDQLRYEWVKYDDEGKVIDGDSTLVEPRPFYCHGINWVVMAVTGLDNASTSEVVLINRDNRDQLLRFDGSDRRALFHWVKTGEVGGGDGVYRFPEIDPAGDTPEEQRRKIREIRALLMEIESKLQSEPATGG